MSRAFFNPLAAKAWSIRRGLSLLRDPWKVKASLSLTVRQRLHQPSFSQLDSCGPQVVSLAGSVLKSPIIRTCWSAFLRIQGCNCAKAFLFIPWVGMWTAEIRTPLIVHHAQLFLSLFPWRLKRSLVSSSNLL